jgi:tetratricopeptide (TPR) repeat protein
LQLSPVGPSSHVFLSNRAAALLSLKRYAAAATDARRAVALAPTFGKAHARLGQSLYFLKDYEGAVSAYEEAVYYEPENEVTKTYLQKARNKLAKQQGKYGQDAQSIADTATLANSIATDPQSKDAVVTQGFRGSSEQILRAVANTPPMPEEDEIYAPDNDPDFDEAVRIQQRANKFLAAKRYKPAIEEYSAALFLVPDDPFLSPELHLGRAHALNGSRRHESARNDSLLAVKIRPSPEAYSTLAKSNFYLKDYEGSLEAFEQCIDILPKGEMLSQFDQAYYNKAEQALEDGTEYDNDDAKSVATARTLQSIKSVPPKLPPPRFVAREEVSNGETGYYMYFW